MEENYRAVLRAPIRTLPVERGRVVCRQEHFHQLAVTDHRRVEGDPNDLRVPGAAAAHGFVTRVRNGAAGVPGFHLLDPVEELEHSFEAPEATAADDRGLGSWLTHEADSVSGDCQNNMRDRPHLVSG